MMPRVHRARSVFSHGFGSNNEQSFARSSQRIRRRQPALESLERRDLLSYLFTTIDGPGAIYTAGFKINDAQQVVGTYTDASNKQHGFLSSNGEFTTIDAPGWQQLQAQGINNSGQIVGWYANPGTGIFGTGNYAHGFLLSGSVFTTVEPPGSPYTYSYGINDVGQVVGGYYPTSINTPRGFLLSGGTSTLVDPPGSDFGNAFGINNRGDIVGEYSKSGVLHGYLLRGGAYTTFDVPGASSSRVDAINDSAQFVGSYVLGGSRHGFLSSGGVITTIDPPGSTFTLIIGINNAGQISGTYRDGQGKTHGFVATPNVDITVTAPVWDTAQGGIDFTYGINTANLLQATTTALYWSADTTFDASDTLIPGTVANTQTGRGTYPRHIAPSQLTVPPAGARYLLAVVDPNNVAIETNEGNNSAAWRSNLAGRAWLEGEGVSQQVGQGKYADSKDLSSLDPAFRAGVVNFIGALTDAGATITINATRRDANRAYLMHYAWEIARGLIAPAAVPPRVGIDIRWDYGDVTLSRQAAQQMVDFLGMTNAAPLDSRAIQGLAIDMQVAWTGTLLIRNKARRLVAISSGPRDANNIDLATRVAATYGVFRKFAADASYWSSDAT